MKRMRLVLIIIGITAVISTLTSAQTGIGFAGSSLSVGACTELVSDGGFEAGGQGWSQYSKLGFQLVSSFYPRSGRLGAWLGAGNSADDRLTQSLVFPVQANSITFSLWWALDTEEGPGGAFDFLRVTLFTSDGATQIASLVDVNNDSAEQLVWNPANADLTPYAGQTLQLRIEATTDENSPTSFFVDDVSVLSCVSPTATASPTATSTGTSATRTLTPATSAPSATATSTSTVTHTSTPGTPGPSATWTATRTVTRTPTPTPTPLGWVSPTPTETRTPGLMDRRIYLPVVLQAQ